MRRNEPKKKLVGAWHTAHVAIWLVGIYILASRDLWWPGILVLVLISAAYEGILQRLALKAYIEEAPEESPQPGGMRGVETAPIQVPTQPTEHRLELLPQMCPSCNAPIRGHEIKWTGAQSANFPYCGTNLPMIKD